ncbi:hypothetical protein DH2020_036208 [Rehmannia glutinosa]|uniref:RRM domain-containing protein n=1 Tax=Rehmannia glutinosa TaxID=99300 RepID=A0ABR0V6X3_REHGL
MQMAKDGRSLSPPSSSPPHRGRRSNSLSRSRRSRSRSRDSEDASNPGNNLYVTGLSSRVTESMLCMLYPHTKESRGFAFVTMDTNEGAERCIKYLNRSVLEGRLITVQKAKRSRGRTPTPGKYQGPTDRRGNDRNMRRSRSHSPRRRYDRKFDHRDGRRGRSPSPYGRRTDDHSFRRRHGDRS